MSTTASSYLANTSSAGNFTFKFVSRNEKTASKSIDLLGLVRQNGNLAIENYAGPSSNSNKGLKEIHFSLVGKLEGFYPLLRGIAGSGQPASVFLEANPEKRNFILQFDASAEGEARKYLTKILDILEAEARFKQVLGKIIANQNKFKLEEKLLFNELSK